MNLPNFKCKKALEIPIEKYQKLDWVSVFDDLPEVGERVLVAYGHDAHCVEFNKISHIDYHKELRSKEWNQLESHRKVFWENSPPKGLWGTSGNPDVYYWIRILPPQGEIKRY